MLKLLPFFRSVSTTCYCLLWLFPTIKNIISKLHARKLGYKKKTDVGLYFTSSGNFGFVGYNYSIQRTGYIKGSTEKINGEIFVIYSMYIYKKIWKRSVAGSFTRKIVKNIWENARMLRHTYMGKFFLVALETIFKISILIKLIKSEREYQLLK